MPKKNDQIDITKLKPYEMYVYMVIKKHEHDGVESTLEQVNFEALKLVGESSPSFKIEPGTTTVKALKKIATIADKTTGVWKLKPQLPLKNPLDKNPR